MNPLVSVIVPIYNHARFLPQTLGSILQQTYRPLEVILIDDGSKDDSFEVAQEYLRKNPVTGIEWRIISQKNQGAHVTINRGIRLAKGEICTVLNSDDVFAKDRLEKMVPSLVSGKTQLVMSLV